MDADHSDVSPVLSYAGHYTPNESRGHRVFWGYFAGLLIAIMASVLLIVAQQHSWHAARVRRIVGISGLVLYVGVMFSVLTLWSIFAFSLVLYWREKVTRTIRYGGFATASFLGFFCWNVCMLLSPGFLSMTAILVLAVFGLVLPAGTAIILCQRDPSQDPCPLVWDKHKRLVTIAGSLLAFILVLGYSSASMSRHACETQMAHNLATNEMGGAPFHVPDDRGPDALRIFHDAGLTPTVRTPSSRFPWADIRSAQFGLPFLVTVEYGWVSAPQVGQGGLRQFFCLFGYVIEVDDIPTKQVYIR